MKHQKMIRTTRRLPQVMPKPGASPLPETERNLQSVHADPPLEQTETASPAAFEQKPWELDEPELLDEQISRTHLPALRLSVLERLRFWLVNNTFAPPWLSERWQHPALGYLIAVLLQSVAVVSIYYLGAQLQVFTIAFAGLLQMLALALVALSWGVGPSILATFAGACLFEYFILPPTLSWTFGDVRDISQTLLFVLVGLAISIVSSQTEVARRRAERLADSLTKEHARLEAIIETVPDMVAIYDKRGRMTQMNEIGRHSRIFDPHMRTRSLEELFRVHEAFTLEGKPIQASDLPVVHALLGETIEGQEIRFLTSEGRECFLSISAAPLRNIRGKIDGVVSVTRDLSALHQSEREAANRALELEVILQSLADGFIEVEPGGALVRSNAAFLELIGCIEEKQASFLELSYAERQALLNLRDEQGRVLASEEWPEARILRGEMLKGSTSVDLQLRNLSGRELRVNVSGAPLYNRDGELIAALCVFHDVTARRQLEQRTRDALDALLTMAEALVASGDDEPVVEEDRALATRKMACRMARMTSSVLGCQQAGLLLADVARDALRVVALVGFATEAEERHWLSTDQPPLSLRATPVAPLLPQLQEGKIVVLELPEERFDWGSPFAQVPALLLAPMRAGEHLIGLLVLGQDTSEAVSDEENSALAGAVAQLLALVFERERLSARAGRSSSD